MKRYVGIDLSATTGFVIQDAQGNIIIEDEFYYKTNEDPARMNYITSKVIDLINPETDIVGIEGFSHGSQSSSHDFQYGIGWIMREKLYLKGFEYWWNIAPTQVKKFATSNSYAKKDIVQKSVEKRWGYYHGSDNITDAFVMSEIVKAIHQGDEYGTLKKHEKEVVKAIVKGKLNTTLIKETKLPSWQNPNSKYYFTREK